MKKEIRKIRRSHQGTDEAEGSDEQEGLHVCYWWLMETFGRSLTRCSLGTVHRSDLPGVFIVPDRNDADVSWFLLPSDYELTRRVCFRTETRRHFAPGYIS